MQKKSHSMIRRSYLATLGSVGALAGTAFGKQRSSDYRSEEIGNGILLSDPNGSAVSRQKITKARKGALAPHMSQDESLFLSDIDSLVDDDNEAAAYYVGWDEEKHSPIERVWSKPEYSGKGRGKSIIANAKRTIESGVESDFSTLDGHDGGTINWTQDWVHLGTALKDRYARVTDGNGTTYTLGKVDLRSHLFQAPDENGHYQMGNVVEFMSYPGVWLDEYDSDVTNGVGLQTKSVCSQNWDVGIKEYLNDVDYAPVGESGGCTSIDSLSIGVDSYKLLSGSITFDPDGGNAKVKNISDPDDSVETRYGYGGFFRDSECGGDIDVNGGNAGVFLWDGSTLEIVENSTWTNFKWESSSGHTINKKAEPTLTWSDTSFAY